MIERTQKLKVNEIHKDKIIDLAYKDDFLSKALFFDLEHYVYKVPICVGVFGCSIYDKVQKELVVTQYMIESGQEIYEILQKALNYFKEAKNKGYKYIVTFSGNNDFVVINYLFKKYNLNYNVCEHFISIDIQKEYEKLMKKSIGLKALEKEFDINRHNDISGSNLAKTFSKVVKDKEYFTRMPSEKKEKILNYNEEDVIDLFYILCTWKTYMKELQ